ncbi:MAG: AAA family ATPase, partial [Prosthecobacter sp.]|uniref:AAA family ATPase n=1 Tax=Prosthecobacter sp. TaxID=1965333 RepID=UPI0019E60371
MIREFTIENFKSIESLTLPLGRVTVLIGENGAGKSNVLEALAFFSAAGHGKLDEEFLHNRGVRITSASNVLCAFNNAQNHSFEAGIATVGKPIKILISDLSKLEHGEQGWGASGSERPSRGVKSGVVVVKEVHG